ncbi:MAG: hypothetical protein JW821_08995 [Deltaproteobacteria bacterium]|nr:hypothetical protein [Deltaproteobacteria bacterium]
MKNPRKPTEATSLPHPTTADLRGRQSVRATFKLTERAVDALSILSGHLGIKQKSLFDHLIEDATALGLIAEELRNRALVSADRVQKTFVLSRRTLAALERASKDFDASRDALVEHSVRRLLPLIALERQRHEKRKEVLDRFTRYLKRGKEMLAETRESLDEADPALEQLEEAVAALENVHGRMEALVERGKRIAEFV